ncbi:MAG: hypothetical protein RL226_919, partial [Bacteroidota bacterium]
TSVTTNEAQYNIAETTADMAGSYTLQVFDGTCFSLPSITETVVIDVIPAEQAFAGESIIACPNSAFTIQAQNASSLTGIWSTDDSGIQIVSPSEATSAVLGAEAGNTYLLTWTLYNAGCGNYSSDEVTVFAPLPPIAADDYQEIVEGMKADANVLVNDEVYGVDVIVTLIDLPDHGTAQVSGDNTIEYTPESGYSGSDALVYEVCFVDCPDQCTTATLRFEVFPFLHVPNIITPNGDGVNDALVIEGIERFPLNRITVYNRWGREIFTTEDYQNNWQGTFNGTACPDGTYFFVFENTDTGEVLENGYFTIHQ